MWYLPYYIQEGRKGVSRIAPEEDERLDPIVGIGSKSRLACQATVLGTENVKVELLGFASGRRPRRPVERRGNRNLEKCKHSMKALNMRDLSRRFYRGDMAGILRLIGVTAAALFLQGVCMARAADIPVAVAANFTAPAKELAAAFHAKTGDTLALSFGASGQLYTQISQGAPFKILLSADAARPKKAVAEGFAVPGTVFTYAIGKLVLWSADPKLVDAKGVVLSTGDFNHLANADPKAAPYGAAGLQTLKALGIYEKIEPKIVTGQTITQTYQFIASGNAELGFVALSEVIKADKGSQWLVPQTLYAPILQDAVLLKPGADDAGAKRFLAFLKSPAAIQLIQSYGYATPVH